MHKLFQRCKGTGLKHVKTLEKYLIVSERLLLHVAFGAIMAISRQNEARSRDYALLLVLRSQDPYLKCMFFCHKYHQYV